MKNCVVGFGSALMDILVAETDDFLERSGIPKGGMILSDEISLQNILSCASGTPVFVPGGSACNTTIGVARLGGKARFVGKRGSGEIGEMLEYGLRQGGVEPKLHRSPTKTGRVVSLITPDAQRSMLTFLGAAAEIQPEEIDISCLQDAAVAHIEGYLCNQPELIRHIHDLARRSGAMISLDLSSFTVVQEHRGLINELIQKGVDILIANEDEAAAFAGSLDEKTALESMARCARIAVYKMGERGSRIAYDTRVFQVNACGDGHAVDTTGAGDLWASGFLYGLAHGYPVETAGRLASACGWEVCRVVGAQIPEDGWTRIRDFFSHPGIHL